MIILVKKFAKELVSAINMVMMSSFLLRLFLCR